jgi:hypothetical protein
MSQDAFGRVALRLRALSAVDRAWILQHLDDEDCQSIGAALQRLRANRIADTIPPGVSTGWPEAHGSDDTRATRERLASAEPSALLGVMAAQPDWTLAVALSAAPWPWAEKLLERFRPERVRRVRALSKELAPRVTPAVRDALLRWLVAKLDALAVDEAAVLTFDMTLDRTLRNGSVAGPRRRDWA